MRLVRPVTLICGLALLAASGCYGEISPVVTDSPSPVPSNPWCPEQPVPRTIFQIDSPEAGLSYTRHVPIHGFVRAETDGFVDVTITTADGGVLASSELAIGETETNGFYEIDGTIVLQLLPGRERACVTISGRGWTALVPIRVGGANP